MKAEEKATELVKKFGCNALEVLEETFIVWNIKRKHAIKKINIDNNEANLKCLEICDRTLNYWNAVKQKIVINFDGYE